MLAQRFLRWVYSRAGEQLTCEIALDDTALLYDLRTRPGPQPASTRIEKFVDVTKALTRQADLEAALVDEGWTLDSYESMVQEGGVAGPSELGGTFAEPGIVMGRPDEQRGKLPEIRTDRETITFLMTIAGRDGVVRQLVLRCEPDGEIYASIQAGSKE